MANTQTPYYSIITQSGKDISDWCISFRYVYAEDTDDYAELRFEFPHMDWYDEPDLKEKKSLKLVWGYRAGATSGIRKVYIQDKSPDMDSNKFSLVLKCSPKAYMLKQAKRRGSYNTSVNSYAKAIADTHGLNYGGVKDYSGGNALLAKDLAEYSDKPILVQRRREIPQDESNATAFWRVAQMAAQPYTIIPRLLRDNRPKYENIGQPEEICIDPTLINQSGSDHNTMESALSDKPGGPWIVQGRDDDLVIRNRNFKQKPIYNYYWGDGELIDFSPETKNRKAESGTKGITQIGWSNDGEYQEFTMTNDLDESYQLGKGAPSNGAMSKVLEDFNQPITVKKVEGGSYHINPPKNIFEVVKIATGFSKPSVIETSKPTITETDICPEDLMRVMTPKTGEKNLNQGGRAKNLHGEKDKEKNPAKATLLGNPTLENNKVISIKGVSLAYSGTYYISECEHNIQKSLGFIVRVQLIRNSTNEKLNNNASTHKLNTNTSSDIGHQNTKEVWGYDEASYKPAKK